ncbi:MAG: C25 family cysteine peptidase [PVC group bacterium]
MKKDIHIILLVTSCCFAVLIDAGFPGAQAAVISHTVNFERPGLTSEGEYHLVHMPGMVTFGRDGEPALPVTQVSLLLPPGTRVRDVRFRTGRETVVRGRYIVKPGGGQISSPNGDAARALEPDLRIYRSSRIFPTQKGALIGTQRLCGCEIAVLTLHPVEYVPAWRRLNWYSSITIEIDCEDVSAPPDFSRGIQPLFHDTETTRERVRESVDNKDRFDSIYRLYQREFSRKAFPYDSPLLDRYGRGYARPLPPPPPRPGNEIKYVIITPQEYKDFKGDHSWHALADQKESRGISTEIVTTEWIYANYSGEDDPAKIRNFITDAYNVWKTEYVLLGGDADAGEKGEVIVPLRRMFFGIPGDIYYACLDGTYDDNGDGEYGQDYDGVGGGLVDLQAEVYVGRAPVDSIEELQNFVRKTIAHENATGEYLHRALLVGEYLGVYKGPDPWKGDRTYAKSYVEEWHHGAQEGLDGAVEYQTAGFSRCPFLDISTLYEQERGFDPWGKDDLVNLLTENGGVQVIAHTGHANNPHVMKIYTADVADLNNTTYPFIHSTGCFAAAFDNRADSCTSTYLDEDCIAERLVTAGGGAFAFVGYVDAAFWSQFGTDVSTQYLARSFWDTAFGKNVHNLGKILQLSKENVFWLFEYSDETFHGLLEMYLVNLLGDPETPLRVRSEKAAVRFERKVYRGGDYARVWLTDRNAVPDGWDYANYIDVAIKSDSSPAGLKLRLYQTDASDPHRFSGTVKLTEDAWAEEDTYYLPLEVSHGDSITVTYTDPNTGSGTPITVGSSSLVDTEPPVPGSFSVEKGSTWCHVSFQTDEPADAIVEGHVYINDSDYRTASNGTMGTEHGILLAGLHPDTLYTVGVRVRDRAGNEELYMMGAKTWVKTRKPAPILVVDDDALKDSSAFESGLDQLGLDYDLWDMNGWEGINPVPAFDDLAPYQIVLWDAGCESMFQFNKSQPVSQFLDSGGRFLLAGILIFNDTSDDFISNYLGVCEHYGHIWVPGVLGIPGDPITSDFIAATPKKWIDNTNCQLFSTCDDAVKILRNAACAYQDCPEFCGVRYESPEAGFKTVTLGLPYGFLEESSNFPQEYLLGKILDWFSAP